jgi:hypothetical protein
MPTVASLVNRYPALLKKKKNRITSTDLVNEPDLGQTDSSDTF